MKRGREAGNIPHLPEILWESSEREHCLSNPISLSVPTSAPPHLDEGIQTEGGSGYDSASTQMEGGSGYNSSIKLLQNVNQVRAQLEYELIWETQELVERHEHRWAKQARRHARWWAQMIDQTDATFPGRFDGGCQVTALVHLCGSAFPLHKWSSDHYCLKG